MVRDSPQKVVLQTLGKYFSFFFENFSVEMDLNEAKSHGKKKK